MELKASSGFLPTEAISDRGSTTTSALIPKDLLWKTDCQSSCGTVKITTLSRCGVWTQEEFLPNTLQGSALMYGKVRGRLLCGNAMEAKPRNC
mmetsp:Transcript_6375/g.11350  ORF Transcript_6375/g.11350 Transcript_6375/m.11350 type:complete len:93 (-) Transcript_6375:61-339(-)